MHTQTHEPASMRARSFIPIVPHFQYFFFLNRLSFKIVAFCHFVRKLLSIIGRSQQQPSTQQTHTQIDNKPWRRTHVLILFIENAHTAISMLLLAALLRFRFGFLISIYFRSAYGIFENELWC